MLRTARYDAFAFLSLGMIGDLLSNVFDSSVIKPRVRLQGKYLHVQMSNNGAYVGVPLVLLYQPHYDTKCTGRYAIEMENHYSNCTFTHLQPHQLVCITWCDKMLVMT